MLLSARAKKSQCILMQNRLFIGSRNWWKETEGLQGIVRQVAAWFYSIVQLQRIHIEMDAVDNLISINSFFRHVPLFQTDW